MKRPILLLSLIYLFGIIIYVKCSIDFILVLLISISFLLAYIKFGKKSLAYIFVFILDFINIIFILQPISNIELKRNYNIEGIIETKTKTEFGNNYRLKVYRIDNEKISIKVNLISEEDFEIGNYVSGEGSFNEVKSNKNFKMFNYGRYLMSKKILLESRKENLRYSNKDHFLLSIRGAVSEFIENNLRKPFDKTSGDFAVSLILGQKAINKEDIELYNELGLSHILAISGLHISIIIGMLDKFGRYLGIEKKRFTIILLIFLITYGYIIDFPVSLIRALLMYAIRSLCLYTNNIQDDINITGLSFFVMLILNPFYIYSQAFWYSFLAIVAVVYLGELLKKNLRVSDQFLEKAVYALAIQIAIFPIQIFLYNDINLLSIIVNLLIIPITSIPVFLAFISAFGAARVFAPIAYIFESSISLINSIVGIFSGYQQTSLSFQSFSIPLIVFYYILLIFALNYRYIKRDLKRKLTSIILSTAILILLFVNINSYLLVGKINFIDVGQGDSILIRSKGKNVLVDVGGNYLNPEKSSKDLYDYLYKNGVSKLDAVFLSHNDFDHSGNLQYLRKLISIEEIFVGQNFGESKFPATITKKGEIFLIGDTKLKVVYDGKNASNSNESSLVLEVTMGKSKVLLTGDLEENEDKLETIETDILKISHHGSKNGTSKEFLKRMSPDIAIISAGRDNRYGHPHKEVIERLQEAHIEVFETFDEGNVEINFYERFYYLKYYEMKFGLWE
ncbi:MAG: DNA internalization-related competence protein ComEC/Rec2 [Tissierellia bacterium]|nr:DNA internalization-related competence protein ComEC/Rec2 [Tissierellia bacterium]